MRQAGTQAHILAERALGHSNEQEGVERFAVGRSLLSAKHTARGYSFCALCSTFFSVKSRVTDVVWPPYSCPRKTSRRAAIKNDSDMVIVDTHFYYTF
jgi:hypothetical protein